MKPIPYGKQNITEKDINAVIKTLKSDYLTQGPEIEKFEKNFANYVGSKYAVAVSNGTAALHLSAITLNIKPGDKVITTPITFVASANCVKYCGGEVIFSDIDPETYLLDIKKVKNLLSQSPKGTYKGLILVDFSGRAINLELYKNLAEKYNLWILEDACHAPGGFFIDSKQNRQSCGNGNFADLSIFSFHPVKHIAAGEGGMITTNNKLFYNKLLELRTHGITKDSNKFNNSVDIASGIISGCDKFPGWYMEMQELGYNYRLTDIQAALANSQLNRANEGLAKRKKIAKKYYEAFKNSEFIIRQSALIEGHAYHLYIIEVKDRIGLYDYLKEKKIYTQIHYFPCHLMPYYQKEGYKVNDFPLSELYYKHCLTLPIFPDLKEEEQKYVIKEIFKYYE
tara:strand:+ start:226 stop:1416 length:1191 start_codon:yes stop_codon:yes gene_type:complete